MAAEGNLRGDAGASRKSRQMHAPIVDRQLSVRVLHHGLSGFELRFSRPVSRIV
jgi:hypothetical protein